MKKQLLIILLALLSFSGIGQITFQKTITGNGNSCGTAVVQTSDGGYVIAGNTDGSGAGGDDIYLVKTSSVGNVIWTKTYGGTGNEKADNIEKTTDGGFIICGNSSSLGAGGYDVFVIKTDPLGDTLWTKTYGGPNADGELIYNYNNDKISSDFIQQTTDGGFIIASSTKSFGQGNWDVYLIKTNGAGDTLWTKTYGDSLDNYGYSVKQTIDGGYIISGSSYCYDTLGGLGGYNLPTACVIKTDGGGNIIWTKNFGIELFYNMYGGTVFQTANGDYVLAGQTYYTDNGNFSGLANLIKMDNNGNMLWSKHYAADQDVGWSTYVSNTSVTNDGGFIFTGFSYLYDSLIGTNWLSDEAFLIKIDSSGNVAWTKNYGKYENWEIGFQTRQTIDGGYVLTGEEFYPSVNSVIYLVKTDSLGNSGCNETTVNNSDSIPIIEFASLNIQSSGCEVHSPLILVATANGTTNDYCLSVNINDFQNPQSEITISPNPFASTTTITFSSEQKNTTLLITDVLGNVILQSEITTPKSEINMSGVAKGIYFVRLTDENKNITNRKIVVQ